MSVVHGHLRRNRAHGTASPADDGACDAPDTDPLSEERAAFEREVARKETLLKEGIQRLQEQVVDLSGRLEAGRKELEELRAENRRLRQGAVDHALAPRAKPNAEEPSLLSKALE